MSWHTAWFRMLRGAPGPLKKLLPRGLKERVRALLGLRAGAGYFFHIDVISACSLRCPSCPVGNSEAANPKGMMSVETYAQVLDRIVTHYRPYQIGLFNWTEPLLHPKLADLVRMTNAMRIPCHLSSNLNAIPRMGEVLAAEPEELRISLSGFTQEVYCQTHAGGKIEVVKENMRRVRQLLDETRSRTRVVVYYHKYKHNLHELAPMKAFAEELGFGWMEAWAVYMPVEGAVAYLDGGGSPDSRRFIEKYLAVPLKRAADETAPFRQEPCRLIGDTIVIDHQATVQLCCAVFDTKAHTLGNFLTLSPEEIRALKDRHPACGPCMQKGLHLYYQHYNHAGLKPVYERIAAEETRGA